MRLESYNLVTVGRRYGTFDSPIPLRLERATIIQSLKRSGGDKKKASELLGINRTTLYRKMKRLNIPIEQHIR